MKKCVGALLAMAVVALFVFGCAAVAKDTKIKCPKCGAVFTVQEGLEELQRKSY